jgi:hypothetical protein
LNNESERQKIIEEKLGGIVSKLPHTPYTAIGFNFVWHITPEKSDMNTLSKKLFFKNDMPLFGGFDTEDARFGSYLSPDFLGCRLKLDIKPISIKTQVISQVGVKAEMQTQSQEKLQFAFNYDKQIVLSSTPVEQITDMLKLWDKMKTESLNIISSLQDVDK